MVTADVAWPFTNLCDEFSLLNSVIFIYSSSPTALLGHMQCVNTHRADLGEETDRCIFDVTQLDDGMLMLFRSLCKIVVH